MGNASKVEKVKTANKPEKARKGLKTGSKEDIAGAKGINGGKASKPKPTKASKSKDVSKPKKAALASRV
jgi:hypothetical protein